MFLTLVPVFPYPNFFSSFISDFGKTGRKRRKIKQAFNEKMGIKRTAVTTENSLETRLG